MNFNKKIIDLPIDSHIPTIRAHIANGAKQIIVHASPGSGKTTRVPAGILEAFSHQVWVLEPRRLAAKMSALRVDLELTTHDPCNKGVVGWQMRDDTRLTEKTKLLFLTEGMLPLRMIQSTNLADVSCLVLDEFHERHAQTDLAFALSRML